MNDRRPPRVGHRIRLTDLSASSCEDGLRRPPPVAAGDLVGVAALSSRTHPTQLARGLEQLRDLGFATRAAANLSREWNGFAGSDEERVEAFHELVADPDVRAIFFARGGHGVLRVLPALDWDLLASSPKAYVGYSDLTPFLLQLVSRIGLVCFHGPMVGTDLAAPLTEEERSSLLTALAGNLVRSLPCRCPPEEEPRQGRVLGGCLSLLVATLGTPFSSPFTGSLLVVEDVNEPFYRIDRMLTHLNLSGSLTRIHGMVLGHLKATDRRDTASCVRRSIGAGVPLLAWGLPCGHGRPNLTLPLGATARIDPERQSLLVLDDASRPGT